MKVGKWKGLNSLDRRRNIMCVHKLCVLEKFERFEHLYSF